MPSLSGTRRYVPSALRVARARRGSRQAIPRPPRAGTTRLRAQGQTPDNRPGRRVKMNDFAAQYSAARQRATTDEYKKIRTEHPAIERKLNELVRWHNGRRVRYRGRLRVRAQYLLLAVVVNCKRIVRLLSPAPTRSPPEVRAETTTQGAPGLLSQELFKQSPLGGFQAQYQNEQSRA